MSRVEVVLMMRPDLPERLFGDRLHEVAAVVDLERAEIVLSGWGCPPLDAELLARASNLRAIVHAAGGVKGHVTDACWERGLLVSTAAGANAEPVAEYTLARILLANKAADRLSRTYRQRREAIDLIAAYPEIGNFGKTVGIVGASRIGRRVVELLRPFDLRVLVSDPYLEGSVELDDLLQACDVVSLHAPSLPSTRHMLDARRLALLRDGATLINTARGALIDQDALVAELQTGRIDAVLDVTEPEVLPAGSPLYDLPNVVLTPHIAGALGVEVRRLGESALAELERYARGEPFAHPVTRADLDRIA
ncbi:hydroxyacid dehydrogenase [Solirubrobacter ginsenosidimutans]|uniref:Hydroxyacid dehydrogenase n=2 Tax=Solirubrobacter ginsenosidimutans TaxID=490573 RepID=A0A9X3MPK4_9ACTN|nr:hydroxyacid dehydrogenase [Solirubrobacter ginsenosidimutans]MDA0160074.1 hydroxyacid dehydrogenase [Solirubrobacter ginsenosidimutans]